MDKLLLCLCLSVGGHGPRQPDRLFGEDKLQHFFVSFLVTSIAAAGTRAAGGSRQTSLWVGAGTGLTFGVAKELNDARNPRDTASLLDLAWDAGGVGLATAVAAQAR